MTTDAEYQCPICQNTNIGTVWRTADLDLLTPDEPTKLHVSFTYPARVCNDCEFEYTDHVYEAIETESIAAEYARVGLKHQY